eukprot:CAMPEP_0180256510 /NCGR_PEP_ID=MMETSP0987-20121128/41331_1 /TAXON_ID=697907 /ORGANISM="non described non described, Strain CCMP2293" /LENGTH=53 /DNA_ID=CAMNT_0022225767 /DNA_START=57 /DNA_END=218 /DNA_ORIENTATION=-
MAASRLVSWRRSARDLRLPRRAVNAEALVGAVDGDPPPSAGLPLPSWLLGVVS